MDHLLFIGGLKGRSFKIPAYQRGYRWGDKEVTTLLSDIVDFMEENKDQEEFYSLQPIVVKKSKESKELYNVIDGQQRLTTIFLIVKYLSNTNLFSLDYATRAKSSEFLQNIHKPSLQNESLNIDFHHFKKAYCSIEKFFENKSEDEKQNFLNTLLGCCQVLWHESIDEEKEVFVRLNSGKIPLAEAENIKALFLAQPKGAQTEREVEKRAKKWYEAEKEARNEGDFIYCVLERIEAKDIMEEVEEVEPNKEGAKVKKIKKYSLSDDLQRIRVYLKAIVPSTEKCTLFDYFYTKYKNKEMAEEWSKLEKAIDNLKGFASRKEKNGKKEDKQIFHYLGFLVQRGFPISELYAVWNLHKKKNEFAAELLNTIKTNMRSAIDKMDELSYSNTGDRLNLFALLLLFNIEYSIEKNFGYFQFNRFVLEQWSLEHIYAQNSESVVSKKELEHLDEAKQQEIIDWLKEIRKHLDEGKLKTNIDNFFKKPPSLEKFARTLEKRRLLDDIDDAFLADEDLHGLQNLTLLDKNSNSALGNLIFKNKQAAIAKLDDEQKLIPIGTREVFRKEFSKEKRETSIFTKKDQEDYLEEMKKYLHKVAPDGHSEEEQ
ncbi:DUF262 domain-containing protein [Helicobacter heilmannii]|uniref:DUF262 domain-containing protein n=1 Tax=Helicobacter heilmannii TaxID=35817 RepID=UPI0006A1A002|nr:DUF262 domain-containing protein [Helicobacter heilmannii]GMB94449.1 DUF262 domain-containing protein [Helicobacter heilmannii]CRF47148.1 FIG00437728: hypothetical protein [Helicobacter heilmannii]CRF49546.1 FIG00437728: hypothetical protein [Helicobacter heilmannii]CRF50756.1 FIG00437728: hypothetical protein [Helicobacter heilmannii]